MRKLVLALTTATLMSLSLAGSALASSREALEACVTAAVPHGAPPGLCGFLALLLPAV